MNTLTPKCVAQLKNELLTETARATLPRILGDKTLVNGVWRFFSLEKWHKWNTQPTWRKAWPGLPPERFFFGEDIFGNQLTLKPGDQNAWLWNHENGELVDLLLDPIALLETVIQSGLDWIDFYTPQMLEVGRAKLLDVPENCHLHWTQPLVLGGPITAANTSVVESTMHLRGHGSLWTQICDLPPGSQIVK